MVDSDFAKITYTEAVALLQKEIAEGRVTFSSYPNWGDDLGSEHERYITEQVGGWAVVAVVIFLPVFLSFGCKLNFEVVHK